MKGHESTPTKTKGCFRIQLGILSDVKVHSGLRSKR
jgi:hypothetical protein